MSSRAKTIIAFVFKRSGKTELAFSDIYLTLSMELNWFTPEGAKDFVNKAIEEKLLTEKNKQLRPSFDISKTEMPIGYSPTGKIFEEKKETKEENKKNILGQIINEIEKEIKEDKKKIKDEIKKIEEEKKVTEETAALFYAKKYDITFDELYEEIKKVLFNKKM